ncbi:Transcriptional regulator, AraC family [Microbacterium esteraromaticum]|uniref:HTH-type transcriptional regulator RipA n=1 Tax=Microbacterium esteraromaticum TaxID=57043 RepID=A0A1R4KSD9_9MICO|nr:AraC family transcriptional regulator [Microbacterium esteraromaticum]SJN47057.1 Transcriptional regulator, AraC family [Microbacterium esteraromaticum]
MRAQANQYPETANLVEPVLSPVLSIDRDTAQDHELLHLHAHPEPMLTWSSTATLIGSVAGRDWLIPPGYGLWVPGGIEHSGAVLHAGEMTTITLAADGSPLAWTEPTSFAVGSLLGEIITHLHRIAPDDPSRSPAEALMFQLLTPLPAQHIHVTMPADPRARAIAELLFAHPDDQRELTAWADHVHASVRTLSRLFRAETGLSFASWRTQVRIRAAIPMLADGTPVAAAARAVGYRKPSAFIAAFHRTTGQTPGTYLPQTRR